MPRQRLDDLIDQFDPLLRKAFVDAVYQLRSQAQIEQIVRMLQTGDVDGALRAVGLDPTAFRALEQQIATAYEAGGVATAASIPIIRQADGFRLIVRFNMRNFAAEQWLRDHSAQLVKDILDDQRAMVRGVLEAGLKAGANPRDTALDIAGRVAASGRREGGLIGLTQSQAQWVSDYEAKLRSGNPLDALSNTLRDARFDGAVERAAETGVPLTEDQISKMVTAYTNRALRYRAEAISRSETIEALHTAQQHAMQQAVDSGAIKAQTVTFTWRSAHDGRVRFSHQILDGEVRKMGEAFDSPLGPIRYPGDPFADISNTINCRCFLEPKIDFFAGVK